jgi:hypothetical protein
MPFAARLQAARNITSVAGRLIFAEATVRCAHHSPDGSKSRGDPQSRGSFLCACANHCALNPAFSQSVLERTTDACIEVLTTTSFRMLTEPPSARPRVCMVGRRTGTIPHWLGRLGVSESDMERHIGWDIGIAAVCVHSQRVRADFDPLRQSTTRLTQRNFD